MLWYKLITISTIALNGELNWKGLSHIIFTDKMKIPLIFILGFHGFMKHLFYYFIVFILVLPYTREIVLQQRVHLTAP